MRWILGLLLGATVTAQAGTVYVCKSSDGGTLFSQTPCPTGYSGEQRSIDAQRPSRGASEAELRQMADDLTQSNAKIRLERDLKNAQKKLKELQDARQGNIRSQTDLAQSIAGPNSRNRSQAIIDDLRTQTEKYNEEIRQQRQKVADTQKRLSEMQASSSAPENSASSGQAL
ncbi:MAG: DUF4124 domain-containing protein [Pseudomonadota bacterium]|jgi:hypothetical protein|nr:DUF4124 domain-containing protein [Pseudomonadota bacterium]MEC8103803.1 DUF4124 domain-containing protein [Pseudomonadota bacterium]MEC8523107.1 DUF4124 domain-containing protein [Pseudomonadota bacterium]